MNRANGEKGVNVVELYRKIRELLKGRFGEIDPDPIATCFLADPSPFADRLAALDGVMSSDRVTELVQEHHQLRNRLHQCREEIGLHDDYFSAGSLDNSFKDKKKRRRPEKLVRDSEAALFRSQVLDSLRRFLASRDLDVIRFRQDCLDGSLLKPSGVREWIKSQAALDGPASTWVRKRRPEEPPAIWREDYPEDEVELLKLRFLVRGPTAFEERKVGVAEGGVLDRLRRISEGGTASGVHWTAAQMTHFILTGEHVPVPPVDELPVDFRDEVPAFARMVFSVDPMAPPDVLWKTFKESRKRFRRFEGGHLTPQKRPAMLLAQMLLDSLQSQVTDAVTSGNVHQDGGELPLVFRVAMDQVHGFVESVLDTQSLYRAWNESHPTKQYESHADFKQACKETLSRLVDPSFFDAFVERFKEPRK